MAEAGAGEPAAPRARPPSLTGDSHPRPGRYATCGTAEVEATSRQPAASRRAAARGERLCSACARAAAPRSPVRAPSSKSGTHASTSACTSPIGTRVAQSEPPPARHGAGRRRCRRTAVPRPRRAEAASSLRLRPTPATGCTRPSPSRTRTEAQPLRPATPQCRGGRGRARGARTGPGTRSPPARTGSLPASHPETARAAGTPPRSRGRARPPACTGRRTAGRARRAGGSA